MPGHIAKTTGPDPDPSPWLAVSEEIKLGLKNKPYDAKKSVWVPDPNTHGYLEGEIQGKDGKKVKVLVNGEEKVYKESQIDLVNHPKFDFSEDMAGMSNLGDACILYNSMVRYTHELIYTYSGLFCIAVNPYKRFPIYTMRTVGLYRGKRRNEVPPHIFAIAEGSYHSMCLSK